MSRTKKIKLPIKYHESQMKIFFEDTHVRQKWICKGRRFGLTKGFANFCIESMLENISPILWVDTTLNNLDKYINRLFIPVLNKLPSSLWRYRQQKKELTIGDAVCDFRSSDEPQNLEGHGYRVVFLNESGIILQNEYLYFNAIMPMLMDFPDSRIFAGGSPRGKNLFYRLCMQAKKNKDSKFYHFTSYQNPFLKREEIDKLAESMPEAVRKQEIYAEFLSDNSAVFSNFKNCIRGELQEPQKGEMYYAGLDLARVSDYTVLIICNSENHMVYFKRFQSSWQYQKRLITEVLKQYNSANCYVDASGLGDPIFSDLQSAGCNVKPYKFTAESKRQLVESLMLAVESETISFPEIPELIDELEAFEYQTTATGVKYSAPSGMHDDCVIGLALVNLWFRGGVKWDGEIFSTEVDEISEMVHTPDFWSGGVV